MLSIASAIHTFMNLMHFYIFSTLLFSYFIISILEEKKKSLLSMTFAILFIVGCSNEAALRNVVFNLEGVQVKENNSVRVRAKRQSKCYSS